MRALAVLIAIVATFAGSVGAFAAIQAVGPQDQSGDYGYGDAATIPPGGGTLLETRNFVRVVAALKREFGNDGALQSLNLEPTRAMAIGRSGPLMRYVEIDASGRSQARDGDAATPAALVPVDRIDPAAIDRIVTAASGETNAPIESLVLSGTRDWNIRMTGGEPDQFVANLDGGGLRLPGEANPEPVGAGPDSLLRTANLKRVLDAAREQTSGKARVSGMDVRPDSVALTIQNGARTLSLRYGYDAQLTSRDISPSSGATEETVALDEIDPAGPERLAKASRRAGSKGLRDVQYVLLEATARGDGRPGLLLYLPAGSDPPYVVGDLHGRRLTWPGRS